MYDMITKQKDFEYFGRNEGKIRLPYEELEELELKYTASKYNV